MVDPYRVPKNQVPVEVRILSGTSMALTLFLSGVAQSHAGTERPSDLLNTGDSFLPALGPDGTLIFLQKDAIEVVSFSAKHELGGDILMTAALRSEQAMSADVSIVLQDGSELNGTIRYLMPEGNRRLQDFLNQPDRFLALQDGEMIRLINKRRIERILLT